MKRVKKIFAVGFLMISLLANNLFATAAVCTTGHSNIWTSSSNVSYSTEQHRVLLEQNNDGPQYSTCFVYRWVEEIKHTCMSCGYVVGTEKRYHANHSFCGVHY